MEDGNTCRTAGQVICGLLTARPKAADRASPVAAAAIAAAMASSAERFAMPRSRPHKYPTRQNTSAYWPIR